MKLKRLRRKGHAYYYDAGGKPRRWIALGSDLTVAMRRYEQLVLAPTTPGTVGELVAVYMANLRAKQKVKESTLATYAQYAKHLSSVFGDIPAHLLSPKDVARYLDKCKRAARDNEISLLRAAYAHAVKTVEGIEFNPCIGIKSDREPAKERRYISDRELEAVIAKARPELAVAIELGYATGLRVSDILKLRWDDFAENSAIVQKKAVGGPRQRYLLTPELRELLARARAVQGRIVSMYVIAGRGGRPVVYQTFWTWWVAACAAAGVEAARFHDVRAKAATDRDAEGGDATKLLGHASAQTTKAYLRGRKVNTVEPLKRRKA